MYNDCDGWQSGSESSKLVFTVALRISDILTSSITNPLSSVLWLALDLSNQEKTNYEKIVNCYLRKYHSSKMFSTYRLHDEEITDAAANFDTLELENIRKRMESANNMAEVMTEDSSIKAAIYPGLMYWAVVHLRVYKQLINLNGSYKYKLKFDEWTIFYTKLLLRYWRPYRDVLIRANHYETSEDAIQNPAERLLSRWPDLPYTTKARNEISTIIESCKVKKGSRVMFTFLIREYCRYSRYNCYGQKLYPGVSKVFSGVWLSCWGSGSSCNTRTCPSQYGYSSPFHYGSFSHGIECRGEAFWIYSNSAQIIDGATVNIKYSEKNGKGYWFSTYWFRGRIDINSLDKTRTCPGRQFTHIKSNCESENIRITKMKTSSSQDVVYDGNFISMCGVKGSCHNLFEIYSDNSETQKGDWVSKPSIRY